MAFTPPPHRPPMPPAGEATRFLGELAASRAPDHAAAPQHVSPVLPAPAGARAGYGHPIEEQVGAPRACMCVARRGRAPGAASRCLSS